MTDILFVHPDRKLTEIYRQKLKAHFRVHTAMDGLAAVRMVRSIKPQAVISDYRLPLLSGRNLVRFVRNFTPTRQSSFIFLTRHDFDDQALNFGANDWISLDAASPDLLIEKTYYHLKLRQ